MADPHAEPPAEVRALADPPAAAPAEVRALADPPAEPPAEVRALAECRARARADRDYAAADGLRCQIEAQGWLIEDAPGGFSLRARPAYQVLAGPRALPVAGSRHVGPRTATVALVVEGFGDDLRACISSVLLHAPGVTISALDVGNCDGAGDTLHELAEAHPGRIEEWHVPSGAGWGEARDALLRADPAPAHVIMDTSTILTGDAIGPLLATVAGDGVVAAGWCGANPSDDLREFEPAGPGPVTALLGYLLAVRTEAALRVGGFGAWARFYRNADLEFSLRLGREGTLVVPDGELPVTQGRHRGYHDSDPEYRDRESRRNYRRVLELLRAGRGDGGGG
jgi:hypothetical protein